MTALFTSPVPLPAESRRVGEPSRSQFLAFQRLIHEEAGIFLSEAKRALLVGRLSRRIQDLGLRSFGEYFELVSRPGSPERQQMIDRVTTNETRFFREPQQFSFLQSRVFPELAEAGASGRRPRQLRAWSAACSTGEEPYSLAMSMLAAFPSSSGWALDVRASDISTRVLEKAKAAVWPIERARDIPDDFRRAFMLRGREEEEGRMKAGPEIRSLVRFEQRNLMDPIPGGDRFDLIFCRNVLIYFDAPTKAAVIGRLLEKLEPGGYLFLGHAESLAFGSTPVRPVGPNIYRSAETSESGVRR